MRMEMLSDEEEKVVDALRLVANAQQRIQKTAAQQDMQRELEDIYHLLDTTPGWEWEERVEEAARRIHNLLY
jgi:hypothetical protein